MSTVQSSTAAALTAPTTVAAAATSADDIQDRFLKLLVTQMKNQDPLNPMDNAQVTSQLAQINTVNGIQQLNTTMQNLSSSFLSAQSLQSTSLIGHSVYTEGSSLTFNGGAPVGGGIDLTQSVDSLKVSIVGPAGDVVRQIDLGAQQGGLVGFQWDGLNDGGTSAAAGSYSFKITASSGGQAVPVTSLVSGKVSSVTLGTDGVHAIVSGIGDVPVQQIKRIM